MRFSLKKRMKEFFAYVLECMLTFDKLQNTSPLMCTKFEKCDDCAVRVQWFSSVGMYLNGLAVNFWVALVSRDIFRSSIGFSPPLKQSWYFKQNCFSLTSIS